MSKAVLVHILAVLFVGGFLGGCVRFTPSRESLNSPFGFDPARRYAGIESFYRYEQEQRARLYRLIEKRRAAIEKDPDSTYRVGPGDKLTIGVKNFEEISREFKITPAGDIRLPFVGNIHVDGKTEDQIAKMIADRVTDYVVAPQVSVSVTEYNANVVWVMGAEGNTSKDTGGQKGAYPLKRRNYSLVDLIVEMGDPRIFSGGTVYLYPARTEKDAAGKAASMKEKYGMLKLQEFKNPLLNWSPPEAEAERCDGSENRRRGKTRRFKACYPYGSVIREEDITSRYDPHSRIEIDLEELMGGMTESPLWVPLVPGDAIFVPPAPIVQVFGEVKARGTYALSGGTGGSMLRSGNTKPFLLSAIIAARGLTYSANVHNIEIFRELQYGNKVVLNVDLENVVLRGAQDVRLRDGDIIWVPSQTDRFAGEHTVDWINQLVGTGLNVDDLRQRQ